MILCRACQQFLLQTNALEKYSHHSKDCLLWPFGFHERLCLLGHYHHPLLQSLFSSYTSHIVMEGGSEKNESVLSLFDTLKLLFSPLPSFSSLLTKPVSLPPYFLVSERASSFLCASLTSGEMKSTCERLSVRWKSPEMGYGLFAREALYKGEIVGAYSGKVQWLSYFSKKRDVTYTAELFRTFPWSRPLVVDAKKVGSFLRFINHNEEPNLGVEYVRVCSLPFLLVSPLRSIEPDEELFLSYGKDFWKGRKQLFER